MIVEQDFSGNYLIFWVAKCRKTGRELTFRSGTRFWPANMDVMRQWVERFYRDLDLIEYRPWCQNEDGKRILYKVPRQHVEFGIIKPELDMPEPTRRSYSLFTPGQAGSIKPSRSLIGAASRSLLRGV